MSKFRFALALALFCLPLVGFAATATEDLPRHSFKLGVGFSGQPGGYGLGLEVDFPRLFSVRPEGARRRSDILIYLSAEEVYLSNILPSSEGMTSSMLGVFSAGLKTQMVPDSGVMSPYVKLGVDVALLNSNLATNKTSVGMRAGFGCDFIIDRGQDTFLGMQDAGFFVEGDIILLHRRADKLAGAQTLLEGFAPQVGFRSHF